MTVIYTESLPATMWREIAQQTENPEFKAQIIEELNDHSAHDRLQIRVDHIIEQHPPAPAAITEAMVEAGAIFLASRRDLSWSEEIDDRLREQWRDEARRFLAAAQAQPGGEATNG